jgi:hypothetical protein
MVIKSFMRLVLAPFEFIFFGGRRGIDNADEGLRYLPIADAILTGKVSDPSILEIGSGAKGITPYVPYTVTGLDVAFNGDIAKNLKPVILSSASIPFPDKSFDYVISVDMLEHVPPIQRFDVISEMLRVADRRIFLAVPCGKAAEDHDKKMDDLYLRWKGERYDYLREHVENGLPDKEELRSFINKAASQQGRSISLSVLPNVNLRVRSCYMKLWIIPKSALLFNLVSPLFCIARKWLNSGECYRQIFRVDFIT